jgi:hypothetical protein
MVVHKKWSKHLEQLRLEVEKRVQAEEEAMFETIEAIEEAVEDEIDPSERVGASCATWGPSAWESGKCDMKTGIWYPDGIPPEKDLGEPIISDMPSNILPQRMRIKAQGSTVYTHLTTKEIAAMTYKSGAEGIYIPAHFPDFVKPTVLHNIYPTTVSYYLAFSGPEGSTRHSRPGLFYPFIN